MKPGDEITKNDNDKSKSETQIKEEKEKDESSPNQKTDDETKDPQPPLTSKEMCKKVLRFLVEQLIGGKEEEKIPEGPPELSPKEKIPKFFKDIPQKFSKKNLMVYAKTCLWKDLLTSMLVVFAYHLYTTRSTCNQGCGRGPIPQGVIDASFAASPSRLANLAEAERVNYEILQNWTREAPLLSSSSLSGLPDNEIVNVTNVEYFMPLVQKYLTDYEETTGKLVLKPGQNRSTAVTENPLILFLMLRRFSKQLTDIVSPRDPKYKFEWPSFNQNVENIKNLTGWPTKAAAFEAANRILRLQQVSEGRFSTIETNASLPWPACYDIGLVALKYSYFTLAIEWFELVEEMIPKKMAKEDPFAQKYLSEVQRKKLEAETKHDDTWRVTEKSNLEGQEYYFDQRLSETNLSERVPRRISWYHQFRGHTNGSMFIPQFWSLCSGDFYQSMEEQSKMFCWLETKIHPTWTIRPLKMEFLSRCPSIVQVYDFLNDDLVRWVNDVAVPFQEVSKTSTYSSDVQKFLATRSSMTSWVFEQDNPEVVKSISDMVARVTGFQVGNYPLWDQLQYISYSIGGHYGMHQDFTGNWYVEGVRHTARIATVMIYLSDVIAGGYTAFAEAGVAARPVKEAVVIWYNLDMDGEIENMTTHGGCPVILGSKQAVNRWIGPREQFLTRKCSLTQGDKFRIPVNGVF